MRQQYTNIAFISYKREDEKWAKWLQKKLEHYKLPTEIRKQNPDLEFAKNPRHVFKDTTDLSGGVLAKAIKEGLDSSKFLIVICSPRAAKSEWVCKEVQDFINSGREENIVPFIIDGEPYAKNPDNECFPDALKALAGERELLGININENGRDSAAVKVVARLFGLRFDTLWDRFQREAKRRRRLVTSAFIAAIVFLLCIIAGGTYAYLEIQKERDRAEQETFRANQERDKATRFNVQLLEANDSITRQKVALQKETDRANEEKDKANRYNEQLLAANVHIENQKDSLQKAYDELRESELSRTRSYLVSRFLECENLLEESQYSTVFAAVQDVFKNYNEILPDSLHDKYEFILRKSYQALNSDVPRLTKKMVAEFPEMDFGEMPILFSKNDNCVYVGCSGLSRIDLNTGKMMAFCEDWPEDIRIFNNKLVCSYGSGTTWYDKLSLEELGDVDFDKTLSEREDCYINASTDGNRILTFNRGTQTNIVWNVFDGSKIRTFPKTDGAGCLSGDGKTFAIVENDEVHLYEIDSGTEIPFIIEGCAADYFQYDHSGGWLLLYFRSQEEVRVINLNSHEDYFINNVSEEEWHNSFGFINKENFYVSDDGRYVAIAGKIYDMPSGKLFFELIDPELAVGVSISELSKKIIQINVDRSMYVYTRNGENLFPEAKVDFIQIRENYKLPEGMSVNIDDDIVFYDRGKVIGKINYPFTETYSVCVTEDKKYALVTSWRRPTTLYNIKTGFPIEEYPFVNDDGDLGFGIIGENDNFYFRGVNTVYQYRFVPLNELLNIR